MYRLSLSRSVSGLAPFQLGHFGRKAENLSQHLFSFRASLNDVELKRHLPLSSGLCNAILAQ